ncbi:MAG: hypothetical protein ACREGC_03940 [Minisyncoccia bacterium]
MAKKPTITICSSANFYKQAVNIQKQLQKHGYKVVIPHTAEKMKKSGDFDASHYRTWLKDASNYDRKTWLMREHFKEVASSDVVLVINEEKHGVPNYIGGNVLMEMALAFHLGKPIYVYNEIPAESMFLEEIIGMEPMSLRGNLAPLIQDIK